MTVSAAALVVVCSAGPATAEQPVSDEVAELPVELVDDLAPTEQQTLSDLTEGEGVRLQAFVDTEDGPEIVTLDAGRRSDATAAVQLLAKQGAVEAAALSTVVRATGGAIAQYGNEAVRAEPARYEVHAAALDDVVVAVLDTGVAAHAELASALVAGQNFTDSPGGPGDATDRQGHGTHVAGTVGADVRSNVEGVAAGVRIMPVKVLSDTGSGWSDWAAAGIVWAADNGADVINMSLGGPGSDPVQAQAIAYARSKGVVVVAAAGNDNVSTPFFPAASAGVIGVAAVDQYKGRAPFSNYGSYVDVAAPGVSIVSTDVTGAYSRKSGTSMASPHVAGVVALMVAAAPAITPDQVQQALTSSTTDLGAAGRDDLYGYGLVDALRAVRAARALPGVAPVVRAPSAPRIGKPVAVPAGVRVSWTSPADDGGAAVTGYRVSAYRGGALARSVVVDGRTTSATLTGLTNGRAYRVGVEAVNAAGYGPASVPATATPRTKPSAPKVGAVTVKKKAVVVRWAKPASDGGSKVTSYVVQAYTGGKLVKAVTAGAAKRNVTVGGLTAGKAYTFRVVAKNAAGTGKVSAPTKKSRPR